MRISVNASMSQEFLDAVEDRAEELDKNRSEYIRHACREEGEDSDVEFPPEDGEAEEVDPPDA